MTKYFCDYCKREVPGRVFRVLSLTDIDGKVWYVCDDLQQPDISIDRAKICNDCARKIKDFTKTLVKEFPYA